MTATNSAVPDLLQRFVPTPYSVTVQFANTEIALQSNDEDLIASLARVSARGGHHATTSLTAKVIRDNAAPVGGSDIRVISTWPVATVLVGAGTVLALDQERRELLGFLSPSVSAGDFVTWLLPLLLELLDRCPGNPHAIAL